MCAAQLIMVFGIPMTLVPVLWVIATLIGLEVMKIGRELLELVSFCGTIWCLGSKKQNNISFSIAKVEYIAAGSSCAQMIWMKQMLFEYGVQQDVMSLYCNNMSAISKQDVVQHSRTKHIDIRHHFIRELVEKNVIQLKHVPTDKQLANIFTKPLDCAQFETLRSSLGLCVVEN